MMKRVPITLLCGLLNLPPLAVSPCAAEGDHTTWAQRVLKVTVMRMDGGQEVGSAVPLVGDRMVTNCHVLRDAGDIRVEAPDGTIWEARSDIRDVYRDLCLVRVPRYQASPMPMVEVGATRVGMKVIAVGYSGGKFRLSQGTVVGMYTCECDGGKVIQTSAQFDRGASGGGLFDENGQLVGILTFKAKAGGKYHFALPVGWLRHMTSRNLQSIKSAESFWERPGKESGHFLVACDLGAKKAWGPLDRLADDWIEQEPDNPEAWMVKGRASLGLNRKDEAIAAFQRVLMLESTHAEAKWELQKLEFDLGKTLIDGAGI